MCYTTNAPTTLIGLHKGNRSEHAVAVLKCESLTLAWCKSLLRVTQTRLCKHPFWMTLTACQLQLQILPTNLDDLTFPSSKGREPGNKARKQAHVIQIWITYHGTDKPSTFKEKIYTRYHTSRLQKIFTTKPLLVQYWCLQVHYAVIEFFTKNADWATKQLQMVSTVFCQFFFPPAFFQCPP